MIYGLPTSVEVCGTAYEINSDFRVVLDIFEVLNDPDLTDQEKGFFTLGFFYPDFENMPNEHCQEALRQCFWFINGGEDEDAQAKKQPQLVDWEQDFRYIIAPVNKAVGREIRADAYFHWWSFLSAYMEIGDCTFAQIVKIRDAKAQGKKLDKADQEWYRKNRKIVDMKQRYSQTESEILKMWGGG